MKQFHCGCGGRVYFDNTRCLACGLDLGFDPERMDLVTLNRANAQGVHEAGTPATGVAGSPTQYRRCSNTIRYQACNWLLPAAQGDGLCRACELNEVIPDLSAPGNVGRWKILEQAKRRLVFELLELGLPVSRDYMRFQFIEDRTTNPDVLPEYVTTGYCAGTITINIAEADYLRREEIRVRLGERYRTVLGHFRHESGHCYWAHLVADDDAIAEFRALFGDERADYSASLQTHYANGPSLTVPDEYLTAYAMAHPAEDWAECWSHFLHIRATLQAAAEFGWAEVSEFRVDAWAEFAPQLNEVVRSLGLPDPYPFVISPEVAAKLNFVARRFEAAAPSA